MNRGKRFALVGAAGYVAPRHLAAISALGHELVAAFDPHDSVGVLDAYAPAAAFFTEYERFDRHLELLRRRGVGIDYLAVCSPNYLHDAHCRLGLRLGADVVCEKPLTLNVRNAHALQDLERQTGRRVWCVLQARLHAEAQRLGALVARAAPDRRFEVEIDYVTPRGRWYDYSWKGDPERSGGVATNIGVHLFDLACAHFGAADAVALEAATPRSCAGTLRCARADVRFALSVGEPGDVARPRRREFRVDGEAFDLTGGFEDLHRASYAEVLAGRGFGIAESLPALAIVEQIGPRFAA